ncbi:MAG: Fe-S protein assembly chaperone HscA [Candidatus Tectomicrobia bacterium]|nr:Fe-S protein assembly chaperone HscA [Candidatus Tectomicrobia bacterium]
MAAERGGQQQAAPIVGIDLGTTNSLVAVMRGGKTEVLADPHSGPLVPSVISYSPAGWVVGLAAKNQRVMNATNTVYSVKRFMGRGLEDLREELRYLPFAVAEEPGNVVRIKLGERSYTPPELSAMVLRELKRRAERLLGLNVARAVITVPAYFNDAQRQATKDAGRLAGLEVMRIVNEPTAAALAYGLHERKEGTIAVYDLGGGTFDISILKLKDGIFEVLATNGDTHLGGDDIDQELTKYLLDEIRTICHADLRHDPERLQQIRILAEAAKCELSSRDVAHIHYELPEQRIRYDIELTRRDFEHRIRHIVERTLGPCRQALADAGLTPAAIDEVVLVGGSTRIPMVRRLVQDLFQRVPHTELNPEEVVALGAAVQASILEGGVSDMLLLDVTPLSLGMETFGGAMEKLIQRNTTIPTSVTEMFTTFVDGQTSVDIHILQGERELAGDNRSLGRFSLKGIGAMPAGMPRVAVTFTIDANGILSVRAKDQISGKEQGIEIKPSYGLTEEEVERMLLESIEFAEEDVTARLLVSVRNEAETVLRATEKALVEGAELIEAEERAAIEGAAAALRQALEASQPALIRQRTQELNTATYHLAALLMDRAVQTALKDKSIDSI